MMMLYLPGINLAGSTCSLKGHLCPLNVIFPKMLIIFSNSTFGCPN